MEFKLEISRNGSQFYELDLFPDQQLQYDVDFYDSLNISKIKLPFYTNIRLPYTPTNKGVNRLNYDVLTDAGSAFPRDDFYFRLTVFGSSNNEITGILNIKGIEYNSTEPYVEVELKDFIAAYLAKVKDINLSELYDDTEYTTRYTLNNFLTNLQGFSGGQAGQSGVQPSTNTPIIFPYVDMNNDTEKYGYPQRQFLEYGTGINRNGLIPAFSVSKFLEYVGDYLSTADFPVRVDSELFAVGSFSGSPAIADLEPEKLYFLTSAHMLAKQDTNTRQFVLRQSPFWAGTNASLSSISGLDGNDKEFLTRWFYNTETSGNSGGVTGTEQTQQSWGARKRMVAYPDGEGQYIRGYFAPKVSFNSSLRLSGNPTSVTISGMQLEIPVVKEDDMVVDINLGSSTMKFTPYIGIWENGLMIKKIPLQDANGDDLELTPNGKANAYSAKQTSQGDSDYRIPYINNLGNLVEGDVYYSSASFAQDTLTFADFDAYFPSDEELLVNGGSRYSVNYFLQPDTGVLNLKYVSSWGSGNDPKVSTGTANADYYAYDMKKLITRIPTQTEYEKLNLTFLANEDFLPHNASDEIIIQDSISKTTSETIHSSLLNLCKRFNCGLYYEYDQVNAVNVLRVDPLHIMRNGTQNIDALVDNNASFKVQVGSEKIKSLSITNKDYSRYFDDLDNDSITIGSTVQEINPEGVTELEYALKSSVFYKSLCGPESYEATTDTNLQAGAFSEEQLGFGKNIYSRNSDIGFRFAYVEPVDYRTWMLTPHIVMDYENLEGDMKTEIQRVYVKEAVITGPINNIQFQYNGKLNHINASGFSLLAEEGGVTTDYYNLFANGETVKYSTGTTVEFSMVVPTSYLSDLSFFFKTLQAPSITTSSIQIKSASGSVYEDYAYLNIVGLLV